MGWLPTVLPSPPSQQKPEWSTQRARGGHERVLRGSLRVYQSECGDHRPHERHWVSIQRRRQVGQMPPVSNVFHSKPQLQHQRSSLRGVQPHSGQRMCGPDVSRDWFCSTCSSITVVGSVLWRIRTLCLSGSGVAGSGLVWYSGQQIDELEWLAFKRPSLFENRSKLNGTW